MKHFAGQSDVERVLEATDLARLMGEFITLRRKGREHVGLCPFHDDRSPSLHIVTHKGSHFYKCFACGASGNAITFAMEYHRMAFPEALRFLAERANIQLAPPPSSKKHTATGGSDEEEGPSRKDLLEANAVARDYYRSVLQHPEAGRRARELFAERGISEAMVDSFELGAAPDHPEALLNYVRKRQHRLSAFRSAGLVRDRSEFGLRDYFRNRLIFPICDQMGRPIAFGARIINADDNPKYLNSPESPLFEKSKTLFGLHLANQSIRAQNTAIVCEGYTDVIALHQHGLTNAVATLGTALTASHARLLHRLCDTVILLFDGDDAGQRAADRAVEVFFHEPIDVKICILPEDHDPDDLLRREGGRERLVELLGRAQDALPFLIERFRRAFGETTSLSGRQRALEALLERLADLGFNEMSGLRKRFVLPVLSEMLRIPIPELESKMPRRRRRPRADDEAAAQPPTNSTGNAAAVESKPYRDGVAVSQRVRRAEEALISILLFEPEVRCLSIDTGEGHLLPLHEAYTPESFGDPACRAIYEVLHDFLESNRPYTMQSLHHLIEDDAARSRLTDLYLLGRNLCGEDESAAAAVAAARLHDAAAAFDGVRDREMGRRRIDAIRNEVKAIDRGGAEEDDGDRQPEPRSRLLRVIEERRALGDDLAALPRRMR